MPDLQDLVDVANAQEPHCPVVLLLDVSGSMGSDRKIQQLNEGIRAFKREIEEDDLARKRVDLSVITFGPRVDVLQSFGPIEDFQPPTLVADGTTAIAEGIRTAIQLVELRKQQYKTDGVSYFRPWIMLITDAEKSGLDIVHGSHEWKTLASEIHTGAAKGKYAFFAIAVEPADYEALRELAPPDRAPARLLEGHFKAMFHWLSKSVMATSHSRPGETVKIDTPADAGWGQIPTTSS